MSQLRLLIPISILFIFTCFLVAARAQEKKYELTLGPSSDCPAPTPPKSHCYRVCIVMAGQRNPVYPDDCMNANYISTDEQFRALKQRMIKVEDAINKVRNFRWSTDELREGFYKFAERVDPSSQHPPPPSTTKTINEQ